MYFTPLPPLREQPIETGSKQWPAKGKLTALGLRAGKGPDSRNETGVCLVISW
jgi:hypothetical protein